MYFYLDRLWIGSTLSDCLQPCTQTTATVVRGPVTKHNGDGRTEKLLKNWITFYLTEEIQTTIVTVDKFDFMDSLNFLGSNLGLWPGMGLMQLLEDVTILLTNMISKYFISSIK